MHEKGDQVPRQQAIVGHVLLAPDDRGRLALVLALALAVVVLAPTGLVVLGRRLPQSGRLTLI